MAIATRLKWYLGTHDVGYDVVIHEHTKTSLDSAKAAQIPSGRLAKCVLLEDERGYLLAIVPASRRIDLDAIEQQLHRHFELASEPELRSLFPDCELGAIPPAGAAYNIPTLIDDSLFRMPDLFLEAGDHEQLIHLTGSAFRNLLQDSPHGHIARRH
jgi:Ala-tRNA(Pro) deacylase